MRRNTKHLVFSVCVAFVLCAFASVASARTIYVPDDYEKIQWAVDNATAGDTIIVRDGIYYESITVSKQLTIKSEKGPDNCIVNGTGSDVFTLEADGIRIEGFTITGGENGIYILSNNNTIINNNIRSNNEDGIELWSNSNIISNNNISSNFDGIELYDSDNNSISTNIIRSNKWDGIFLWHSNNNIISNNNISSNNDDGIFLYFSDNNSISENIIRSNKWEGICLSVSNNNSISNNIIGSNNDDGICLGYSNNNSISNNKIRSNYFGIDLSYSNNNSISENNISSNDNGIVIWFSNNNIIYMNNFINNTCNAFSNGSNIWNSTETITYTYKGKTFTNYLGNYWEDYTGSDADGDGIGDTPYSIDSDRDNYPLIERFENYFVLKKAKIFDTGRPENPYPSISGEFVGTIKTNKKIIATKLYTYACEGTGGHTEYAIICNKTWCAEAKWEGYKEDWMNISFNRTVVLMPYETYNITIVTGSYPQIHHTSSLKTENGWINCTEFIDANGKKYENWIPAIKLWS